MLIVMSESGLCSIKAKLCAGVLLLLLSIAECVLYYYYHTVFVKDCAHLISNTGVRKGFRTKLKIHSEFNCQTVLL